MDRIGYEEVRFEIRFTAFDLKEDGPARFEPLHEQVNLRRVSVGWPMKCFQRQIIESITEPTWARSQTLSSAHPWSRRAEIVYPTTPIWHGVAVNSLVYVGLLLVLALLWRFNPIRRGVRLRRGLCPQCAYPIGISERCTECGENVTESLNNRATGAGAMHGTMREP